MRKVIASVLVGVGLNLVGSTVGFASPILYNIRDLVGVPTGTPPVPPQTSATASDFKSAGVTDPLANNSVVLNNTENGSGSRNGGPGNISVNNNAFEYSGGYSGAPSSNKVYQQVAIRQNTPEFTTISGLSTDPNFALVPNQKYDFYLFTENLFGGAANDIITYDGTTYTFNDHPSEVPIDVQFTTGGTVADSLSFEADPAIQSIDNTTTPPTPNYYPDNAAFHGYGSFAIVAVPEPASLSILGLAGIPLLARRRRV